MAAIAKLVKIILTISALITSAEAIARLAKLAWSLWISLKRMIKIGSFKPNFKARLRYA